MKPQNSRSLWSVLADQIEILTEIDHTDPIEINQSKLNTNTNIVNTGRLMNELLKEENKLAISMATIHGHEEYFRNPQLKEYRNIQLPE